MYLNLTKEEKQKLIEALTRIEAYICDNIVPYLCGSSITVDFGPMETYLFAPYHERKYHLYVSEKGISTRTGGLGGLTIVPTGSAFGVYETEIGLQILKEWHSIKCELNTHIAKIIEQQKLLNTFEL